MINKAYLKFTKYWLILGLVMIFFQVFLGGITRITGSGLSITKWDIVTGSIPPLNSQEWESAFNLYKVTPQYIKMNEGMSLSDFKFIYFWEFTHRLFARWIGLLFFMGFAFLLYKRALSRILIKELLILVILGGIVGSFGWIMVKSGLMNRPWVNAYKLSLHLNLAFLTFAYLAWIFNKYFNNNYRLFKSFKLKRLLFVFATFFICQLLLGGLMSGMKAGLVFPTWPDMNGQFVPSELLITSNFSVDNLISYDSFSFAPALIQFFHRLVAYILFAIGMLFLYYYTKFKMYKSINNEVIFFSSLLIAQVCVGILTVINCVGTIPVFLGVLHQAIALILIFIIVRLYFSFTYT